MVQTNCFQTTVKKVVQIQDGIGSIYFLESPLFIFPLQLFIVYKKTKQNM